MKIQLNTDSHIIASEALTAEIENKINSTLKRFSDRITRIEVHLSDLNSAKAGPDDKRCVIEARVAGLSPVSVSHEASTLSLAIDGARDRMANALDTAFGKRETQRHDHVIPTDDPS